MGKRKTDAFLKAMNMYILQEKTAKEIAKTVGVTEKTLGTWVKKYKWKEQRQFNII